MRPIQLVELLLVPLWPLTGPSGGRLCALGERAQFWLDELLIHRAPIRLLLCSLRGLSSLGAFAAPFS